MARRPVTIAGRHLRTLEQFSLEISDQPLASGGKFQRRILRGPFEDATTDDP